MPPGPNSAAPARKSDGGGAGAGPAPGGAGVLARRDPVRPDRAGQPLLVLAHGFTQTGACWGELGQLVGAARPLLRVDLPGHGGSAAVRADVPGAARLLVEAALDAQRASGAPSVDLLGYSLGARVALQAALDHPGQIGRLILVSATAGIADPEARQARRARDQALADGLERSGDLEAFLHRWLASPMFAGLDADHAGWAARLENIPAGLASSLRLAGAGTQEPLWGRLGTLSVPLLTVAGATDPRFVAHALAMAAAVPAATASVIPGAGHAAHLHRPRLVARLVTSWLRGTEPVASQP